MKATDYISLALKGWSLADIKELKSFEGSEGKESTEGENIDENVTNEMDPTENENVTNETEVSESGSEVEVDYKRLYEQSQMELKELQKENVRTNISDNEKSTDEQLSDLVRSFY